MSPTLLLGMLPVLLAPDASAPVHLVRPALEARAEDVDEYEAARAAARAELVTGLEEVAAQANKDRAFLQRDLTYEVLLELEPDHARARKALGWKLKKGEWTRSKPYKKPSDKKPALAIASLEAREALLLAHRDGQVDLVLASRDALGPARWRAEVDRLLEEQPDQPRLRAELGQVSEQVGGRTRWILEETRAARAHRKALETARAASKPKEVSADGAPASLLDWESSTDWTTRITTDVLTVLGDGDTRDDEAAVINSKLVWSWLPLVFGPEVEAPEGLRVYLIEPGDAVAALVEACPDVSPTDRLRLAHLPETDLGSPLRHAVWCEDPRERRDRAVLWLADRYLATAFGLEDPPAWLRAGLRAYVAEHLLRRRLALTWRAVDRSSTGAPDWVTDIHRVHKKRGTHLRTMIQLSRQMFADGAAPTLADLATRDAGELTAEDTLLAYTLVAYLIEGREPVALEAVLRAAGDPAALAAALSGPHHPDLEATRSRLREWADEIQR